MGAVLGCIADDFTGATDLAGLLARSGATVSLRIGVPARDEAPHAADFEVIALKCRTAPKDEAIAVCRDALDWLQAAGAERFFWKYCSTFDSTPDGNIGPVSEALMADIGCTQTIYCPAFPENGRAIFMGNLFVGQQPLHESPMKDHPLTPMRDSNLMRLLTPQVAGQVGLIDRLTIARGAPEIRAALAKLRAEGIAHVIMDAVADEDLALIAEACQDMPLLTGGSAVAQPLPALYAKGQGTPTRKVAPALPDRTVVLSGSCSQMTRAQVAAYLAQAPGFKLDPVELSASGPRAALDWLRTQAPEAAPLIYATAEPEDVRRAQSQLGVAEAGALVERALAEISVMARDLGARRFVVAGGETSGAVTSALGVTRLDIRNEIAPGVPWCFARSNGADIAITLKSGNFGAETFFADALSCLDAS